MTRPGGAADGATVRDSGPAATRVRRARLRIVSGPEAGRALDLVDEGLVIGSQAPATLVLSDANVSRRHAEIRRAPNGWLLVDLDSTNGTFIDEIRIGSVYLGAGLVFRVGRTSMVFEAREEPARIDGDAPAEDLGLVAEARATRELCAAIRRFAPTDLSVVLEGETGTGKEVAARAVHRTSARREGPLVVVDCGALHENLVESELFGHEKGAFTGASDARAGAFESAEGGTLFLDEVGELPLSLQPKLLRALEAREVRRLGSNRVRSVDVRVVAATNRDLSEEVVEKRFRADLFFRLSEVRLRVPPLRERPEDVAPLARAIADETDPRARLTPAALEALASRAWPGNVRELGNVVRRAIVAAAGAPVGPEHLAPAELPSASTRAIPVPLDTGVPLSVAREAVLDAFHRAYFESLLERHGGDLDEVARDADVHVQHVRKLLRGLKPVR